jgi:hypothetical protein
MRHRLTAAGLLAAAALAAPSAAAAAADTTLTAGPLKVRAYQMTLVATDAAHDALTVMLTRRAGSSMQTHVYSFDRGVTVNAGGRAPSIAGRLGRYGVLRLTLGGMRGGRGSVPAGCTGTPGRQERGTFAGKLDLTLDTTYFRTVRARSLPGMRISGGALRCGGSGAPGQPGGGGGGLTLSVTSQGADGSMLMLNAARDAGGKVAQTAMKMDGATQTAPASVSHMISSPAAANGLTAAADLSSASAVGAAPFLAGTMTFAGEGLGQMASGTVGGDFAARFDSIGTQRPPADAIATLMRR